MNRWSLSTRQFSEVHMADDSKPKPIIVIPDIDRSKPGAPLPPSKPMRTREELSSIVQQLTQNTQLMDQLRGAIGSDDKQRMSAAIDQVECAARNLDPSVTMAEAVSMTVSLAEILGKSGSE